MPTQTADATWNGDLKNGNGTMRMQSGSYEGNYSFASRFEDGDGTNPEELIGAAHAGCYAMALSNELAEAGFDPRAVDAQADGSLGRTDDGRTITGMKLSAEANIREVSEEEFQQSADGAKKGWPVSKALAGTDCTLDASLKEFS